MWTAISPSPLPGLCHSSIAIIATSLILLLAMLLLMLFNSVHVCKVLLLMSCQHGRIALKNRPGQQCARANSVPEPTLNLLAASFILHVLYLNQWFSKWGHIAPKGPHHVSTGPQENDGKFGGHYILNGPPKLHCLNKIYQI